MALFSQAEQSANLRRLIMLAMDTDPVAQYSNRSHVLEEGFERFLPSRMG
jgi:hypothetical protein